MKVFRTIGKYWLVILPIIMVVGCNDLVEPEPERLGYEYFPLTIGAYRIYDVKEINYNLNGTIDSYSYQLKEIVSDSSIIGGDVSYRLDRFHRLNNTEPWIIDSVWSARINTYQAIVVEHNVPIIKLSFPLEEDKRWNGNAMNALDFDEFKIRNLGLTYIMDGNNYPQSVEMLKEYLPDDNKIANTDIQIEVYSKGVGLILRQDSILKYCNPTICPIPGVIEEGRIYDQKLIEIGKVE